MLRLPRKLRKKPGMAPGSLVHTGERKVERVTVTHLAYDAANLKKRTVEEVPGLEESLDSDRMNWIAVCGIHDPAVVQAFGDEFGLHPLLLEDVLNTSQRPKCEEYGPTLFLVLRQFSLDDNAGELASEQISIVFRKGMLLSFEEQPTPIAEAVRSRIEAAKGRIRGMGADYLAYCLLDAVVDQSFYVVESIADRLYELQDAVLHAPGDDVLAELLRLKNALVALRRDVWPLREAVHAFLRAESDAVSPDVEVFMRDVVDHTASVVDACDAQQDLLQSLLDVNLASVSNRTNQVMQVLTIIATIFIPVTFIAGVYGMNFKYMPELEWRWGYPAAWLVMAAVAGGMLLYFRKRRML